MAKRVKRKHAKQTKLTPVQIFTNYWSLNNYIYLGIGLVVIIIGYLLMAQGPWDNPLSLSASPIVLLFAYLVVIPFAILYSKKKEKTEQEDVPREDKG